MSGALSYHAGLSAEDQVARRYAQLGLTLIARRWRGKGGEVDLILDHGGTVVFVEVKKSRDHARAAARVSARQVQRLFDAGAEFLGTRPGGLNAPARFDIALVDGTGHIHIIENALCA
jgi:putative endonuclease